MRTTPWLTVSAASSPANEFRLGASVLWPGFMLQNEHSLRELESSLWTWQTVICRESTSLEFSFCYWLHWTELSTMCWKILEAPKILAWLRRASLVLPCMCICLHSCFMFVCFSLCWLQVLVCIISSVTTCAPPRRTLNLVSPGSQQSRWVSQLSVVQFEHFDPN